MLIALITCDNKDYAERRAAVDKTWVPMAKNAGFEVEVFTGKTLNVPDDYGSLPLKTKAMCQWVETNGYDRVLKIDDDSFLNVPKFKPLDVDYGGLFVPPNDGGNAKLGVDDFKWGTIRHPYASGGAYWLSRRGIEAVAKAEIDDWAEDRWVGQVMGRAEIKLTRLAGYEAWTTNGWKFNPNATVISQLPDAGAVLEAYDVLIKGNQPTGKYIRPLHRKVPVRIIPSQTGRVVSPPKVTPALAKPVEAIMTPIPIPNALGGVSQDWRGTLLGAKVARAVARGFKVAAVCPLGSSYHKQLSKAIPKHIEEIVDTPEGKRVLFLVK